MQQVADTDAQIKKVRRAISAYRRLAKMQPGPLPDCRSIPDLYAGVGLVCIIIISILLAIYNRNWRIMVVASVGVIYAGILLSGYEELRQRMTVPLQTEQRLQEVKQWLLVSDDKNTLPLLLEMFDLQSTDAEVRQSLIQMLSRLEADDVYLLNTPHRQHLYRLLQKPYSMNLALELAVVGAMEHVGDSATPAILARLLRNSDTPPPLAQAAQQCLDALNARSAQQNQTQTLLRAAPTPAAPAAHLLRPAQAATPEDAPKQLLRASGNSDNVR